MRILKALVLSCCVFVAACAGNRTASSSSEEYVEIDNPHLTMSPNAPQTVWVPKSYVESGPPRGSELVKKGAEKVSAGFAQAPSKAQPPAPAQAPSAAAVPAPTAGTAPAPRQVAAPAAAQPAAAPVKNRIALLEIGQNGLGPALYQDLRHAAVGVMIDPAQATFLARFATITNQAEKGAFAKRLQQDYAANLAIFITAPDGIAPGKTVTAEVFDAMGGGFLRRFDATIPPSQGSEQAVKEAAVTAARATFTERIKELVLALPWYGRITEVEGTRVYIAAGKEAGLKIGQLLNIYSGGRFVEGLGFAPGEKVGTVVISGFVGPNGSFGSIKEGQGVKAADVVSVE